MLALRIPCILLTSYLGDAIRDREYMTEKSRLNTNPNPFVLEAQNFLDKALIDDLRAESDIKPHDLSSCPPLIEKGFDTLPGGPWDPQAREKTKKKLHSIALKNDSERYLMALIGSLILVGPMLLMVLVNGVVVRLVTAGACTIIFAFSFARLSERTPLELMSVTAAYTAVLVVFVGTSTLS